MTIINKVLFVGSKPFGLRCLEEMHRLAPGVLVGAMTLDDRADVRSAFDQIKAFCDERGVPLIVAKNRKDSEEQIRQLAPELCLVNGWYWLVGDQTLEAVPRGFLGIHNSLLPKYRGGSPLVWTMINGEKEAGLSLFSFTRGMDEGDIWAQAAVPIEREDYISDVLCKLEEKAVEILREKYLAILDGKLVPVPQDPSGVTYCAMRSPEDGLIDWNKPAEAIYNFIRAQSEPYPGAFTFLEGKKLVIWRARPEKVTYYGTPGQVARISPDGVTVIAGDNAPLILEAVELEGVKGPAASLIKSVKARLGR